MTYTHPYIRPLISLASLALVAAVGGCGLDGGAANPALATLSPAIQVIDRTTRALSTGAMQWVNGTYTGCTDPAGAGLLADGTAWSARISGSAAMTNAPLTVVNNDSGCTLAITSIVADTTYIGTPAVAIGTSYNGAASSFSTTSGGPISFYVNAKASALTFTANFAITILFSDNVASVTPGTTATYASVTSASNAAVPVLAPDYTATFGSFALTADISQFVQTATGTVTVTAGSNPGEYYIINTSQSLGSSFAAIDTAYLAGGTPVAIGTTIDESAFSLLPSGTVKLPVVRNVIIVHTVSGVSAYEVIRITFSAAGG
jgi:hypothetical protein